MHILGGCMITQSQLEELTNQLSTSTDGLVDLIEANDREGALACTHILLKTPAFAGVVIHSVCVRLLQWMNEPPYDVLRLGLDCTSIAPELRQEIFCRLLLKNAVRTGEIEVVKMVAAHVDPCWQFSSGLREAAEHQNAEMFEFLHHMSDGDAVRGHLEGDCCGINLSWWDEQVALMQHTVLSDAMEPTSERCERTKKL